MRTWPETLADQVARSRDLERDLVAAGDREGYRPGSVAALAAAALAAALAAIGARTRAAMAPHA